LRFTWTEKRRGGEWKSEEIKGRAEAHKKSGEGKEKRC